MIMLKGIFIEPGADKAQKIKINLFSFVEENFPFNR